MATKRKSKESRRGLGEGQASPDYWAGDGLPKYSSVGVERTVPPSETARRVAPLMERIGVTRVGDVSHLDRSGLPNFLAVRPRDLGPGISYYNGKGATRGHARAGAMMEAIERYSGERCDWPVVVGSYAKLVASGEEVVNPEELLVPRLIDWSPDLELEWTRGFDLLSGGPVLVPTNSVVCPYESEAAPALFISTSNGLASGNTRDEAVCHALCELIERDSHALYEAAGRLRDQVRSLLGQIGFEAGAGMADGPSQAIIEPQGLPTRPARVLRRLVASGLRVYLRDITSETRIPAIYCVVAGPNAQGLFETSAGMGCHPDAALALLRALTEAAQSRMSKIQGGREDLSGMGPRMLGVKDPDSVFGRGPRVSFAEVDRGSRRHRTVSEDVAWIIERLRASRFSRAVAVDLTLPELGVPVVRVVIPGAESWALQVQHMGHAQLGRRALDAVHGGGAGSR